MTPRRPRIGISACFQHPDDTRPFFKGKRLLYVEESMAHFIMEGGAIPYMVPTSGTLAPDELVRDLDGLVLHGGADVCPRTYGEEPLRPEWNGDEIRDRYEIALVRAAVAADKPVFGICRGAQVLNVALGGSLYQDIVTQHEGAQVHRDAQVYDQLGHEVTFVPGSRLEKLYGRARGKINSVHHQAIKKLAPSLVVEARSIPDDVIEAVRGKDGSWVFGVQWHPEWTKEAQLDRRVLLDDFMRAVRERMT
jgi:putative glutamine amidotransferase